MVDIKILNERELKLKWNAGIKLYIKLNIQTLDLKVFKLYF